MQNMIQNLLAQQGLQGLTQGLVAKPTTDAELVAHQEPVAAAMRSLMKILEYEKKVLDPEIFAQMVDSLKENLNHALDQVKIPAIPPMGDIVSINGEPAQVVSGQ